MMLSLNGILAISPPVLQTLGRLHVAIVHFPIALLCVAAIVETWRIIRRKPDPSPLAIFCLITGGLSAIAAGVLGWIHKGFGTFGGEQALTLGLHQWIGIAAAAAAVFSLIALLVGRRQKNLRVYRVATILCAGLVAAAGHFGGSLTHGSGYLTELVFAPKSEEQNANVVTVAKSNKPIHYPQDGNIDFIRDVQPIFEQSCYECHSAAKRRGSLRLDNKVAALKGGNTGAPFVANKSADSVLIKRVLGQGIQKRMPIDHPALPDEQIKILTRWIDTGANWPDKASIEGGVEEKHWAFVRPKRPEVPAVKDAKWPRNPIDNFILARLDEAGLSPSPEADRATLIRRLSLDLIGLPPTPDEVDAFVNDPSANAYDSLVSRLLSSPHYGERWGRHWLDIARYADTNGYEKDNMRAIWPYRDWVIDAINRDVTFDQFTIQQIAGDMLPNATTEDKIATGFHRNTMFNEEGGIDVEEFRFKAIVDRVQTTAAGFLGVTLQCAQCHNHKYDPFSQKEYYQFFSFVNNADEPYLKIPNSDIAAKREAIEDQIDKAIAEYSKQFPPVDPPVSFKSTGKWSRFEGMNIRYRLGAPAERKWMLAQVSAPGKIRLLGKSEKPITITEPPAQKERNAHLAEKMSEWEREACAKCAKWTVLEPVKFTRFHDATITKLPDNSLLFTGDNLYRDEYDITYKTDLQNITAIRLEVLSHPDLPKDGPGRNPNGGFVLSEVFASALPANSPPATRASTQASDQPTTQPGEEPIKLTRPTADAAPDSIARAIDGDKMSHWTVLKPGPGIDAATAVFQVKGQFGAAGGTKLRIRLSQNYFQSENLGRVRISVTADPQQVRVSSLPADVENILVTPADKRTKADKSRLKEYYLAITPLLAPQHAAVAALRTSLPEYPTTLVMQEKATPRVTRVHHRGEFLQEEDAVEPGVPAVLHPLPKDGPNNRLTLARWLVDESNPLVGRVVMNRFWNIYFGRGIVPTTEDFGIMGEKPSHPELLDWLATEFIQRHWSMKEMHRLIVTSATYRQTSRATDELLEKDPQNVLLARGPRMRVESEIVRDIALSASGLLTQKIGGPSVFPPQPPGVQELSYGQLAWKTSEGPDRYRRGMYTFLKRTSPYPALTTFDAPTADITCTRRIRSNTPLQALTVLNDQVFVEAAQAMAKRIMTSPAKEVNERAKYAFRLCVARLPEQKELSEITAFYEDQLKRFKDKSADPAQVALADPARPPKDMDLPELAAWTTVTRAMLNLDETVTKE